MPRQAFREATEFFLHTLSQVPGEAWASPGLGEWSVRDLVGHTSRSFVTLEAYAGKLGSSIDLNAPDLHAPVDYFLAVRGTLADPSSVAQRGREAGQELGEHPVALVEATAKRVSSLVEGLADDVILTTPVGGMRLIDYLPTRIFELTVHTLDVAQATDLQALDLIMEPPPAPLLVTLHLLADLAVATGAGPDLALAVTGRLSLPQGFSVLG